MGLQHVTNEECHEAGENLQNRPIKCEKLSSMLLQKICRQSSFYVTVRIRTEDFLFSSVRYACVPKKSFFFQEIQTINAILTLFDEVRQIAVQTPQFKGQR